METAADLWKFLPVGYALTVLLETPVLLLGLSRPHSIGRRIWAGIMLTACTYPIVVLVLPLVITPVFGYATYVAVAEIFAPAAECLLFYLAVDRAEQAERKLSSLQVIQDMAAIVVANLCSWLIGAALYQTLI